MKKLRLKEFKYLELVNSFGWVTWQWCNLFAFVYEFILSLTCYGYLSLGFQDYSEWACSVSLPPSHRMLENESWLQLAWICFATLLATWQCCFEQNGMKYSNSYHPLLPTSDFSSCIVNFTKLSSIYIMSLILFFMVSLRLLSVSSISKANLSFV